MKKIIPSLLLLLAVTPLVSITYATAIKEAVNNDSQKQYRISFVTNGGSDISSILYINGDDSVRLPNPRKSGFVFGGWYLDDGVFEKPFSLKESKVNSDITLYAKWVIKEVKVYLDTATDGEFEPLIYNVGDIFRVASLPNKVNNKVTNGLSFSFLQWVTGNELPVTDDFILEDAYYEFHATYGGIDTSGYSVSYQSDFSTDYGYLDNEHSWTRGEMNIPKAGIGEGAPNQDIHLKKSGLFLSQTTYDGLGYGAKVLLPDDITNGKRKYAIETTFRISKMTELSNASSKASDAGFGIMVGYDKETGAHVEAVVDPNGKMVRIAAINKSYQKSSTDVNKSFSYPISSSLEDYHRLKVVFDGEKPNQAGQLKNTTMEVYFDDIKCYSTKTTTLNKNWFYEGQARGECIGLAANLCEAEVRDVILKSYDGTETYYQKDFTDNTVFDGWKYLEGSDGANIGQVKVDDGVLILDSYFKNQSIKKHQAIYSPDPITKDFSASFDFRFVASSDIDKYFAFLFRGNKAQYNALFFRSGKGQIQLYRHGEKSSAYSGWSTGTAIKTISGGFSDIIHHAEIASKDNYLYVKLDGEVIYSSTINEGILIEDAGSIGFLASASKIEIDNLSIYHLEKKEMTK